MKVSLFFKYFSLHFLKNIPPPGTIFMAYVFTVFNSLQGFVIFMTLIVFNKQVRNDLHRQIINNQV